LYVDYDTWNSVTEKVESERLAAAGEDIVYKAKLVCCARVSQSQLQQLATWRGNGCHNATAAAAPRGQVHERRIGARIGKASFKLADLERKLDNLRHAARADDSEAWRKSAEAATVQVSELLGRRQHLLREVHKKEVELRRERDSKIGQFHEHRRRSLAEAAGSKKKK
jgi:hypothetical protein